MELTIDYFLVVLNSVIRMTTPILMVSLASGICSKVQVFNIGLEGTMLAGAFSSIVINFYTHNIWLSILGGGLIGVAISLILAIFVVKFKANSLIVGIAINASLGGLTTFLLSVFFHTKGVFSDSSLVSIPEVTLPVIGSMPYLKTVFESLTVLDYLAFIFAVALYIFFYKTYLGYRLRAVGINKEAARSLGTNTDLYQIIAVGASGFLAGLGGCLLSMGAVTLFMQNMTSGRGFIALAADSLGMSHPIGILVSSLIFGLLQSVGNVLQNSSIKTQLTSIIPYAATIVALAIFNVRVKKSKKVRYSHGE